jgi:hypothetical protein
MVRLILLEKTCVRVSSYDDYYGPSPREPDVFQVLRPFGNIAFGLRLMMLVPNMPIAPCKVVKAATELSFKRPWRALSTTAVENREF